jgi:hypothetical protein
MSEQSERWSEVGSRLEALALKLKLHYEQTGRREEIPDAMDRLRASVSDAFDATGNAVRDEAVKADVKEAGRLFVDAVASTFAKVSESLKEAADNMKEKTETVKAEAETGKAEPPADGPKDPAEPPKPIDPA